MKILAKKVPKKVVPSMERRVFRGWSRVMAQQYKPAREVPICSGNETREILRQKKK